jgi:hypothetical protein
MTNPTIKDLKEAIADLPDDMLVGDSGHFGEFLECYGFSTYEVRKSRRSPFDERFLIFKIDLESAGEEPD